MRKSTPAYLTAGELGIRNNIAVLPCGGLDSLRPKLWSAEELKPYANYMPAGTVLDSLFEGFVFQPVLSSARRFFHPLYAGFRPPAVRKDWMEWFVCLFTEGVQLHALAEASSHHPDVWITLPFPHPEIRGFKVPGEAALNFARNRDRLEALKWWIGECMEAWNRHPALGQKLRFRGFVWPRDTIGGGDLQLAAMVNAHIRSLGLKSMWICNYGSPGVDRWRRLGFDAAVLHSNYTGAGSYDVNWLRYASLFAKTVRAGLLLVKGKGGIYGPGHFDDYLRMGLPDNMDYMGDALKVFAFPNQTLAEWMREEPQTYDRLYRFLKGTYEG